MKTPTEQLQLLEETIEYYSKNPRAISNSNTCVYLREDGARCAIGRICDDETIKLIGGICSDVGSARIWPLLPPAITDYGQSFLVDLQRLHDGNKNWSDNGLSQEGKRYVDSIKSYFNLV